MLFYVIAYLVPGSVVMFVVWRLIKTSDLASVARMESARAGARLEETRRATRTAEAGRAEAVGQAREALAQTRQALTVAQNVELVSEQVQDLSDYLVSRIDGEAARRGRGRHALPPAGTEPQAVISGDAQEEIL